jgi:hypothetical protein
VIGRSNWPGACRAPPWATTVRADHDAISEWQTRETNGRRSPFLHGLWWTLSTVGIGLGVVAAIVLIVNGLN